MRKRYLMPAMVICAMLSACSADSATDETGKNTSKSIGFNTNTEDMTAEFLDFESAPVPQVFDRFESIDITPEPNNHQYAKTDINYHRHLSVPRNTRSSFYNGYSGNLVNEINVAVNRLETVKDTRAIVYKNNLLVTVLLENYDAPGPIKNEIEKIATPKAQAAKKKLTVVTDQGVYYRTLILDNGLRDGGPREFIYLDMKDMFENLGIHESHPK